MPEFTAKDVQSLRQATGAGMMDAKRALEENGGDFDASVKWLREKGLAKSAARSDRDNSEGAVTAATAGNVSALAELKCETDFVAKSDGFLAAAQALADAVAAQGEGAAASLADSIDDLKLTLKENIDVGRVIRFEAADGNIVDTYLHKQDGRGKVGVLVELAGGSQALAHDIAIHIAFTKPDYLARDEVPADKVQEEREVLLAQTKTEGKPEAAWDKIVEGKLSGWLREVVLLEQKFVRDESKTIEQLLSEAGASIARFGLIVVGA